MNDILYRSLAKEIYGSHEAPGAHEKSPASKTSIRSSASISRQSGVRRVPIPQLIPDSFRRFARLLRVAARIARARLQAGRFSFNVKGGRCEACQGDGLKRIEMNFLPDVYVTCDVCRGKRYNFETLQVKYKGCSIADLLELDRGGSAAAAEANPQIRPKLQTLLEVGLGYIHLGQSSTTLSGGEAQRIKLAKELSRRQTGKTMYVLDEPTTGLHFEDVRKLLEVLQRLVDLGNTVLVIEHNLDVIKSADWILDLGPDGGEDGGRIVAAGTPEQVMRSRKSFTAEALRKMLRPEQAA